MGGMPTDHVPPAAPAAPETPPHEVTFRTEADPVPDDLRLLDLLFTALSCLDGGPGRGQAALASIAGPDGGTRLAFTVDERHVAAVYKLAQGPDASWSEKERQGAAPFYNALRSRGTSATVANGLGQFPVEIPEIPEVTEPRVRQVMGWWTGEPRRVGGIQVLGAELKLDRFGTVDCTFADPNTAEELAQKLGERLFRRVEVLGIAEFHDGAPKPKRVIIEEVEIPRERRVMSGTLLEQIGAVLDGRSIDTSEIRAAREEEL